MAGRRDAVTSPAAAGNVPSLVGFAGLRESLDDVQAVISRVLKGTPRVEPWVAAGGREESCGRPHPSTFKIPRQNEGNLFHTPP